MKQFLGSIDAPGFHLSSSQSPDFPSASDHNHYIHAPFFSATSTKPQASNVNMQHIYTASLSKGSPSASAKGRSSQSSHRSSKQNWPPAGNGNLGSACTSRAKFRIRSQASTLASANSTGYCCDLFKFAGTPVTADKPSEARSSSKVYVRVTAPNAVICERVNVRLRYCTCTELPQIRVLFGLGAQKAPIHV